MTGLLLTILLLHIPVSARAEDRIARLTSNFEQEAAQARTQRRILSIIVMSTGAFTSTLGALAMAEGKPAAVPPPGLVAVGVGGVLLGSVGLASPSAAESRREHLRALIAAGLDDDAILRELDTYVARQASRARTLRYVGGGILLGAGVTMFALGAIGAAQNHASADFQPGRPTYTIVELGLFGGGFAALVGVSEMVLPSAEETALRRLRTESYFASRMIPTLAVSNTSIAMGLAGEF